MATELQQQPAYAEAAAHFSLRYPHGDRLPGEPLGIVQAERESEIFNLDLNHATRQPAAQGVWYNVKQVCDPLPEDFRVPTVTISARANAVMAALVDCVDVECSWMATAYWTEDDDIFVEDVFIPHQTGNHGLTTITEEGDAQLLMELAALPDGAEKIADLKCWGHSHHRMGVWASPRDESQAYERIANRDDFFLRFIMNKRGDLNVTLYLIDQGLEISHVSCVVEPIDTATLPAVQAWVASEVDEKHTIDGYGGYEEFGPEGWADQPDAEGGYQDPLYHLYVV